MIEINKVYNEDCLIGMHNIDNDSIDCIICDLPYFKVVDAKFDNIWNDENDYLQWVKSLIISYQRILKPGGNIFLFTSRQYNRKICNFLDDFFEEKDNNMGKEKRIQQYKRSCSCIWI